MLRSGAGCSVVDKHSSLFVSNVTPGIYYHTFLLKLSKVRMHLVHFRMKEFIPMSCHIYRQSVDTWMESQ